MTERLATHGIIVLLCHLSLAATTNVVRAEAKRVLDDFLHVAVANGFLETSGISYEVNS